jgi:hypothetical protein
MLGVEHADGEALYEMLTVTERVFGCVVAIGVYDWLRDVVVQCVNDDVIERVYGCVVAIGV